MSKKIFFLMILASLLLPSIVHAAYSNAKNKLIACYDFEASDLLDQSGNGYDGTGSGTFQISDFGTMAYKLNGADDYFRVTSNDFKQLHFSVAFFIKYSAFSISAPLYFQYRLGGQPSYISFDTSAFTTRAQLNPGSYSLTSGTNLNLNSNNYYLFSFAGNNGNSYSYVNYSSWGTFAETTWFNDMTGNARLTIGNIDSLGNGIPAEIESVYIYNFTMNSTTISELYNNGIPLSCVEILGSFVTYAAFFTGNTPEPGIRDNNIPEKTISVNCSVVPANFTLYFGNMVNNVSNAATSTNADSLNWTISNYSDSTYFYKANCGGANTSIRNLTIDSIAPQIIINPGTNILADNSTMFKKNDTLIINITALHTASFLYAYEASLRYAANTTMIWDENDTPSGLYNITFYNLTKLGYPYGKYIFRAAFSDSHTSNQIPEYQVNYAEISAFQKGDMLKVPEKIQMAKQELTGINPVSIEFITAEGNDILIQTELPAAADTEKQLDKYSFSFDFNKISNTEKIFHLISENPISYIENSRYKAHFVIMGSGGIYGNWVDFNGIDSMPIIKKISDYEYIIIYYTKENKLQFSSIGGLNINSLEIMFEIKQAPNITDYYPHADIINMTLFGSQVFNVTVSDAYPLALNYSWYKNGIYASGQTNYTFTVAAYSASLINISIILNDKISQPDSHSWLINATGPLIGDEPPITGTYLIMMMFLFLAFYLTIFFIAIKTQMLLFYILSAFTAFGVGILSYMLMPHTAAIHMITAIFFCLMGFSMLIYVLMRSGRR